ncbi:MAG: DNA-processing protein DprA [Brachybacterium sp.]|nr:DNA-processing protein DprA [Brachybacterium sp.]MDN5900247.1 DNA-processing protein DprA [Brachybacterium sp.]
MTIPTSDGGAHPTVESDRTARITWSLIAEPSDLIAFAACTVLGPADALELARRGNAGTLLRELGGELPRQAADPERGASRTRMERAIERWTARLSRIDVEAVRADARRCGIRVLTPQDGEWPELLDDLQETTPHCLWAQGPGQLDALLGARTAALVGSRASTPYGEDTAAMLASAFAAGGGTVVSGGAYGIDAAAHRGALAAEGGATIAVLAGGLDRLYPRGNTQLLETIRARHLLVSEAPPGTAPTRWRFLARNRLIAALSRTTVVVEASWRSGALSTARLADQLSRPVGAVPGPVTSAASAGSHRLLRERGAVLITEPGDLLDLLPGGPAAGEGGFAVQDELDLLTPADRRVLDAVPPRSSIAETRIADEVGFRADEVDGALARLELLGLVERSMQRARRARPTG